MYPRHSGGLLPLRLELPRLDLPHKLASGIVPEVNVVSLVDMMGCHLQERRQGLEGREADASKEEGMTAFYKPASKCFNHVKAVDRQSFRRKVHPP